MGTRHLIAVQLNGEYKVSQYGQWDGYPSGQGVDVLDFLRKQSKKVSGWIALKEAVSRCSFVPIEELKALGDKWLEKYPHHSRDLGAEILQAILDANGLPLQNSISFAGDSLFCEYAYVIDLDNFTFEIFKGFNESPLAKNERFADKKLNLEKDDKGIYFPVKFLKSYPLGKLPTDAQFTKDLEEKD